MASKVSKIGSMLGMESKARSRKAGVDIAKVAGTKVPRMLFDTFGGAEIPILESAFSKWEDKRNKLAESKLRKNAVDQKYHKDTTADKSAKDMVEEARKSREDAKQASQAQTAHQQKIDAYQSAVADQGSSQIKILANIRDELQDIKSVLRLGGRNITHNGASDGGQGGGMLGALWNLVPGKLKGKLGGKAAEVAEKLGGKRLGSLVKGAAVLAGAEGLGHTAAEVAGSGLGAAAKSVAPEAAEGVAKAASGGILGKITGFGKSALSSGEGLIESGKGALGKVGGWFKGAGKAGENLATEGIEKVAGKEGVKVGGEEATKLGGKMLLKEGGKAIPLLGNLIGLGTSVGFAGKRLWEGDLAGAAMEGGSGLLNLIPGVGNYLSIAADLAIAGRDLKRAHSAGKLAEAAGKAGEKGELPKTAKEISEEGAKIVEEKADAGGEGGEGSDETADADDKKKKSKLSQIAAQLSPIQPAYAEDVPIQHGAVKSITKSGGPVSPAAARTNTKASPMDRLVGYMAGLFDLASDDTKGIYVRQSNAPFQDTTSDKTVGPPQPAPAASSPQIDSVPSQSASLNANGDMVVTAQRSSVTPVRNGSGGSSGYQPGAATNGGWAPGNGSGQLHINEGGGGPADQGGPSSIGAVAKSYGKVAGFDIDGLWEQMKGTIAQGESGKAGYNAHNGGTIPNLTNMTIGQLRRMKGAMGKYQLLPGTTLGMAARAVGLGDNDLFSPSNQEAMGKYLFAMRVKRGARGGPAGIQQQLALEWASLPKDASGRGAYDGYAGNMAAGGSARGSALQSIISGAGAGSGSMAAAGGTGTADAIDAATTEVAKSDTSGNPTVVVQPQGPSGGGPGGGNAAPGTGSGVSGPMVTRNSDSSVQSITQNFIAGSSAMG